LSYTPLHHGDVQAYALAVNKRLVLFITILAFPAIAVLPWLWRASHALASICALAISVWCVWLMVLYLKWARRLGQTPADDSTSSGAAAETRSTTDIR
jgi:hypothetical protein